MLDILDIQEVKLRAWACKRNFTNRSVDGSMFRKSLMDHADFLSS